MAKNQTPFHLTVNGRPRLLTLYFLAFNFCFIFPISIRSSLLFLFLLASKRAWPAKNEKTRLKSNQKAPLIGRIPSFCSWIADSARRSEAKIQKLLIPCGKALRGLFFCALLYASKAETKGF